MVTLVTIGDNTDNDCTNDDDDDDDDHWKLGV